MSRSNPSPTTPVRKYFAWAGATGALQHYDREAGKRITVKLPFRFMVLDELTTIGGFSDANNSGIWSNEVRSVKDPLIVRTSAGTLATGNYQTLKDQLKAQGGKYARSVYIAYQEADGDGAEWVIGNIKLVGAALGSWFDFHKRANINEGGVSLTGSTEDKKGSNTFHVPTFEGVEVSAIENETAIELDKELQAYLKTYFDKKTDDSMVVEHTDDEDYDKPIDLSEIPF